MRTASSQSPHSNARQRRLPLAFVLLATAQSLLCQQPEPPKPFPPENWQAIDSKELTRTQRAQPSTAQLSAKNVLQVHLQRPEAFDETVITDQDGKLLARTTGHDLEIANGQIGDRYVIYLCQSKARRALRFREGFIQFPAREFPGKTWQPRKDAKLVLDKLKQSAPRTMIEAFQKPHQITFAPAPTKERVVYLMTKFEAGGKEAVASQSLTGTLRFWMHAKRGESFRIYEIYPGNQTYRASKTMTVEQDYPLGK